MRNCRFGNEQIRTVDKSRSDRMELANERKASATWKIVLVSSSWRAAEPRISSSPDPLSKIQPCLENHSKIFFLFALRANPVRLGESAIPLTSTKSECVHRTAYGSAAQKLVRSFTQLAKSRRECNFVGRVPARAVHLRRE